MRISVVVFALFASVARADLLDQVISRATDITGARFQSCGDFSHDDGEDCFLHAYDQKLAAIATFAVNGKQAQAAEARVLTPDGKLTTISAFSDRAGLTEKECRQPFIAIEFTKRRVRCKDDYRPPLGASILKSRPVWLTTKEEHPVAIEHPEISASVCPAKTGKIIAQLLVDALGNVPEVQLIIVPPECSREKIENVLKRWRYTPPKKNGEPIAATVEVLEISFKPND